MLGHRACGRKVSLRGSLYRSLGFGGQKILLLHKERDKPLSTIAIPNQAFLGLTIDDGAKAASPN